MRRAIATTALVLCGCAADGTGGPDGGVGDPDAAPGCGRPVDPPPWIGGLVDDALARLAGEAEIASGVTLADRASVGGRDATRTWLAAQLAGYGYAPELHAYGTGANVVARLAATTGDPGWILVGAHFDTVPNSPGANDNATGVAATLAVARQLRGVGCRRAGVIVAFFDQEETGIVGSTELARTLFQSDTELLAVHTIDQVGWDQDGDRTYELETPAPALEAAYQVTAARLGARVETTATTTSDHQAFRERGFPATGVSEEYVGGDTTPYFHAPGDRYDTVEQAFTVLAARLVAETLIDAVASE